LVRFDKRVNMQKSSAWPFVEFLTVFIEKGGRFLVARRK